MSRSHHTRRFSEDLDQLHQAGLLRLRRCVTPLPGGWCELQGRRLRNFASNDYLDLAGHDRLRAAAQTALRDGPVGARASPLVTGRSEWHERLEDALATFTGHEAALLFPTGYAANLGTIPALVGPGDVVFCDRLNHASLIDGCRLSRATFRVYPNRDVAALERDLKRRRDNRLPWSRWLIVTDSVFSMDGTAAPLTDLLNLCNRYDALLLVDEAHATGVLGPGGRGLTAHLPHSDRLIKMGTLSKALGSQGGFVCGTREQIDWLFNQARTQVFSTALLPAACAAALEALTLIQTEPRRRDSVLHAAARLRQHLLERGLDTPHDAIAPIVPIILGDPEATLAAADSLTGRGHLVAAIRPPTVPQKTSRLRISLTAAHSAADVDELAVALTGAIPPPFSR